MSEFLETIDKVFAQNTPANNNTAAQNTQQNSQNIDSAPQSMAQQSSYEIKREEEKKEKEQEKDKKNTKEEQKANNSVFLEDKRSEGYQLTHINENETNFFQYGDALSDEVKDMILNSFDCEQDYVLQQQIAELFKSGNVWQSNTLINQLYSMGFKVDVKTVQTQYITDWKNGRSSYLRTDGAIDILTISDGKGGQIVIADSNGNGAIEVEELFMNEILDGLAKGDFVADDIGEIAGGKSGGGHFSGLTGSVSSMLKSIKNKVTDIKEKSQQKIAQSKYNRLVDEYISKNSCKSVAEAIAHVNRRYNCSANDIQYSGRYKGVNLAQDIDTQINFELNTIAQAQTDEAA